MTQSHPAEKTAERCAGELLWNVSLLPVFRPRQPEPSSQVAIVVELPRELTSQEALRRRRRNAA